MPIDCVRVTLSGTRAGGGRRAGAWRRRATAGAVALIALAAAPRHGSAQRVVPVPHVGGDTVEVVAGADYDAGPLHRALLGDRYRDLWAAPIRVPVLDLDRFAGGLTPTERGGRKQTTSLRFIAPDGREFVFRSVDKYPLLARTPDLEDTYVGWLIRDQTAALFPGAAVTLPPLLEAAAIVHVVPQLAVMPDDPRLGEYRAEFAGMLGLIEERPDEGEDGRIVIAGSTLVIGTERLRERLLESPEDRVDSRAMLTARLVDMIVNDRDRHWDQWRWARFEAGGTRYWRPIPEDRDYAYVDFNGVLPTAARMAAPHMVGFGMDFSSHDDLSYNAYDMDRHLLADLPWAAWDSTVAAVRAALTDEVVESAIARLPAPYRASAGERIRARLLARRNGLEEFAREWYAWLSTAVDVHATDAAEIARAEHAPDGSLRVRIFALDDGRAATDPFFDRRFLPDETEEVRIFLHGGDDHAVVSDSERPARITVRLVGGAGDDFLSDSTTLSPASTVSFHDAEGRDRFQRRAGSTLDTRAFVPPDVDDPVSGATYRDFGGGPGMSASASYGSTRGVEVSVGRSWTRYGFRAVPHASEVSVTAGYSLRLNAVGVDVEGDWRRPNSRWGTSLLARATQLEPFRFFGLGNDTPERADDDPFLVERDLLSLDAAVDHHLSARSRISFGPAARYSRLRPRDGAGPLVPADRRESGQIGFGDGLTLDRRERPAMPRRGMHAIVRADGYPLAWGAGGAFARVHSSVATYLSALGRRGPTLALRAGGARVFGDHPIQEAAFIGGWETLRGYDTGRFAGDAAAWGATEARMLLARPNLLVRGDLGGIAFADAGRVFVDGQSPGGWHTGVGGGLYFLVDFNGMPVAGTLLFARGETDKVRIQLGAPF